jgi:hypothetical protein
MARCKLCNEKIELDQMVDHIGQYHKISTQVPAMYKKYVAKEAATRQKRQQAPPPQKRPRLVEYDSTSGEEDDVPPHEPPTNKKKYKPRPYGREPTTTPEPHGPLKPIYPLQDPYEGIERCDICDHQYADRMDFYMHDYVHYGRDVNRMAKKKRVHILTPDKQPVDDGERLTLLNTNLESKCLSYNAPLKVTEMVSSDLIAYHLRLIFGQVKAAFKVKVGCSRILRQIKGKGDESEAVVENGEEKLRFFLVEHDGECMLAQVASGGSVYNHSIIKIDDIYTVAEKVETGDLKAALEVGPTESGWELVTPTNLRYYVSLLDVVGGRRVTDKAMPTWLKKRQNCIVNVLPEGQANRPWDNTMCFYRCLAYHTYPEKRSQCQADPRKISQEINAIAVKMADSVDVAHRAENDQLKGDHSWQYRSVDRDEETTIPADADPAVYPAVGLNDFSSWLEMHFRLNIMIYVISDDGKTVTLRYASECTRQPNRKPLSLLYLYPHQFEPPRADNLGHYVYISDVSKLGRRFICGGCTLILTTAEHLRRHIPICLGELRGTKERFVGDMMTTEPSLLESLY